MQRVLPQAAAGVGRADSGIPGLSCVLIRANNWLWEKLGFVAIFSFLWHEHLHRVSLGAEQCEVNCFIKLLPGQQCALGSQDHAQWYWVPHPCWFPCRLQVDLSIFLR